MMKPSFNLIDQPFVPCRFADGPHELGLREALLQAHEIYELRDSSPLVTVALHRLLLAILHSVFGPEDGKTWKTLWDKGRFQAEVLDPYLEKWRDRFDLFHEQWPFFQDAAFQAKKSGPINQIVRELARGHNDTLFDHTTESPPPSLGPAAVARALIAEQAFAIGGGNSELGYTSGGTLAGAMVVFARGERLFETLMLNLVGYPDSEMFISRPGKDAPCWQQSDRPIDGTPEPAGYLDYLTWLPRSIHLHPDGRGLTSRLSFAQGRNFKPHRPVYDPMVPYRETEQGDRPLRLQENRDLWRDSAALFQLGTPDQRARRPRTLEWLSILTAGNHLSPDHLYSLTVIGLCTDKAKVNFWCHETLPLHLDYLADNQLVLTLKNALELTENVGKALRVATAELARNMLAPGEMAADKDRVWAVVDAIAADRLYWSRLEVPFRAFLVKLPGDAAHQKRQFDAWFVNNLRPTALAAFEESAGQLDHSGRVLRALVAGGRQLRMSLGKIAKEANIQRPQPKGDST